MDPIFATVAIVVSLGFYVTAIAITLNNRQVAQTAITSIEQILKYLWPRKK
jgi:uncharacterized membrane-anchored protein YitT (DUF2179 family)